MNNKSFDDRLEELLNLKTNWNGHGAGPVSPRAADCARAMWAALEGIGMKPPQLVPLDGGSLQMEWHEGGFDIEIQIMPYEPPQKGPTDD